MLWEVSSTESSWGLKNKPASKVACGLGERKKKQTKKTTKQTNKKPHKLAGIQRTVTGLIILKCFCRIEQSKSLADGEHRPPQKGNQIQPAKAREGDPSLPCMWKGQRRRLHPAAMHAERPEETPACHMWKGQRRDLKSTSMQRVEKETQPAKLGKGQRRRP